MPTVVDIGNSVDAHVGARLKLARASAGVTQKTLGEAMGITWQQIQKYEHGVNRVSASMLWRMSTFLNVQVSFFFAEMGQESAEEPLPKMLELTRVWRQLTDDQRRDALRLMQTIASGNGKETHGGRSGSAEDEGPRADT